MSTQILVFASEALSSPIHCRLIEAAGSLPRVRIADLGREYADKPLDAVRERLRLKAVDTVILQIGDGADVCPALDAWLLKALALEASANEPDAIRAVVRRVGAVVVRSDPSPQGVRDQGLANVRPFLNTLKRAVESVGIDWLPPQVIGPNLDGRAVDAGIGDFIRRLEDHTALEAKPERVSENAGRMRGFDRRVTILSAVCALACALAQAGLSQSGVAPTMPVAAWADLVTAWLGISLVALVASVAVREMPFYVRFHAGVAAILFAFQSLSALVPDPVANVLGAVPPTVVSTGLVMATGLVLMGLRPPVRRIRVGGAPVAESRR